MRLMGMCRAVEAYTFEPTIELTLSFKLEQIAEMNARFALDIEAEFANAYGQELVKILKIALTDLTKRTL